MAEQDTADLDDGRLIDTSTRYGEQWNQIINNLNKLENVKADMETGVVRMYKDGKWHILCAGNVSFIDFIGEFVVNYDRMAIGLYYQGRTRFIIYHRPPTMNRYTLRKRVIGRCDTRSYLGIIDRITNQYVEFPPIVYIVGDMHFNEEFEKIATGSMYRQPLHNLKTFQHIHILNENLVLITHKDVVEQNNTICIGDQCGYLLFADQSGENGILRRDDEIIKLEDIYNYVVYADSAGRFRGFVINDYIEYNNRIYEIGGVWLGSILVGYYTLLVPVKPTSGTTTKAALRAAVDN